MCICTKVIQILSQNNFIKNILRKIDAGMQPLRKNADMLLSEKYYGPGGPRGYGLDGTSSIPGDGGVEIFPLEPSGLYHRALPRLRV